MSILELVKPSQDIKNFNLLKQAGMARKYFWSSVVGDKNFADVIINIYNVVCEKCEKIISDDQTCSCVKEVKPLTAGRGKKKCKNCPAYSGPRTIICGECGYNFKTGVIESSFKKKEKVIKAAKNKKKKKSVPINFLKVKSVKTLIDNDKIEENILLFLNHPNLSEDQKSVLDSYMIWRDEILVSNKALSNGKAHLIYYDFLKKGACKHFKIEDLEQEAFFGLIKAFNHYDEERTYSKDGKDKHISFSTMADPWLRKACIDAIYDRDKPITVPQYIINHFKKFKIFYNVYFEKNGHEPSIEEIVKALKVNEKCAAGLLILKDLQQNQIISVEETTEKYKNDMGEDSKIGKKDMDLMNKLSQEHEYEFDYMKYLDEVEFVKPEYKELVLDHFGFNLNEDGQEYTIAQLEEKYDVTPQTINNVIKSTLQQMRDLIEE